MRKTPLSFLVGLFILFSNIAVSQCQYSFSSFGQSVYVNGDPSMTNVNTLSTCSEYVFNYSISFSSSSISSVTDDITIGLPLNVSFQNLISSTGTVTVNSSTANTVSLHVSGWNISSGALNIQLTGISSSCDAATVTGNPLAELDGTLACGSINSSNGVTIVSPQLLVDNISQPGSSTSLTKNIGDVDEIVFKIRNTGGNGTVIQNLLVDYTLNSIINSFGGNYYLSASSTQGTGTNSYTYTLPGGSIYPAALPASTIPIVPADFQNVLGHGYLANNEEIYLHIPYFVNACGASTGNFNFKRDCGSSITCDNVALVHNISVITGMPNIGAGNVAPIHDENATFCATAGGQDMDLGWHMVGSNSIASGGPLGYSRATNMQLLLLVDNSFGSVDPSSFTISNGASSINVGAYTTLVNPAFPLISTPTTGSLYKVDLTQLPVSGTNWQPLGANSISDLDGDGFVDDLIEYGVLDIHVDYTYNTTCPLYSDHGAYYTIATLQWHYGNACGTPVASSAVDGNFTWYTEGSTYGYDATGAGGELTLPPDVIAGEPFSSELCFAPYYEDYTFNGLEFDCPNGFHRVIYEVPNGYHLNTTGLTASTSNPGWYELPDMTVTSVAGPGPTQQVSPIAQEYCNPGGSGRIIEVRFGKIPSDLYFYGRPYTMQLPCLDLPMYLNCDESDINCPGLPNNFGFDNMEFKLEFVCDETCNTCTSYIVGGHASTFHHCNGECASYFGTEPHPVFKRTSLGYVNTPSGYILGSDLTQPSDLTTNTEPTIDLSRAYPGDQVALEVNGSFNGTPGGSYTPNTGASYNDIYLQIRYEDLPSGERKYARIFDLEQLLGDEIIITENSPVNGTSTYPMPVSSLTMTDFVSGGVVYLNINFSSAGLAFMDEANATYTFESNLHMRVRAEPISSTNHYFFSYGRHIIESLRFEYKGTETDGETIDGSCDDYGANFKILQPNAFQPDYTYIGEATYCGETAISLRFFNDAALNGIENDFSNEYRAYAQWGSELDVTIPGGYTFLGATFGQDWKQYNTSDPNNFGTVYASPPISLPITPQSVTSSGGNTLIHFNGINATDPNPSWPALDLEASTGSQYIFLRLLPNCDVPQHSSVAISGDYTVGVNQDLAAYQYNFPFSNTIDLGHYAPNINIINPIATSNAYDGTAEFTFSVCNENVFMTGPANQAWFAFENSSVDGLDLANATLVSLPGNTPVSFTTYTDGLGHQGIIVNYGLITQQGCVSFKLTAHVSANGCVNGSTSVADYVSVYGGNSCDGSILTAPSTVCTEDEAEFAFNRYPSDLELILPEDAYPTDPVEMCSGILEYNFILNSYEVGGVSDVDFWLDLPTGLSLSSITFSDPGGTPTSATLTSYDGSTYGSGGNLPGWDVLSHLGLAYLPGSVSTNHEISVHLEVQSSCNYDLASPVLCYANSINSCGQQTDLLEMSSLPLISNVTLANDLVITPVITFSDSDDTLSCNNTATVTLTIENNSSVSNVTDLDVVAQVPASPLIVNPGTGTLTGNEVTWDIPANTIPANSTITVTYTITNPGVICQNDVPMSASIHFSQDVSCTSTGGSCDVDLTTDTVYFDIDVCCNCDLSLEMSSEPKHCKYYGSATVDVSGGSGTYTYLWSDGQTTSTAVNLVPGTYSVTVTDEEGCTRTDSVTVGDNSGPLVITATADQDTVCSGETVNITPGGGNSYSMTSDGINFAGSTGEPFVVNPTTTTTYTVYGSDEFGCSGDTTIAITVIPLDTPLFHIANQYCYGATIAGLPGTSLNGITGTWSPTAISNTTSGTITFTPDSGQCAATYTLNITINPVPTITVNSAAICAGQSATLTASGATSYSWTPSGTLSSPTGSPVTATPSSTTTYTVTGTNEYGCSASVTSTVTVNSVVTPTFAAVGPYCRGASIPALPTTSTNSPGITGTWSPAIDNVHTTTYTFTPTAGQCATTTTLTITITPNVLPTFAAVGPYCSGATIPSLPTTSTNSPGITGTWSPAINNTATTTYTFTPDAGQCAVTTTLEIVIKDIITPAFKLANKYCAGSSIPALPTTSIDSPGITGTWSPAINNTATTTYTFTPTAGQCATTTTITITIFPNVTPTFAAVGPYCSGSSIPALPTTSTNSPGITGTWSPAINNTATTTYTFTPSDGQCATTTTLTITIKPNVTPTFTQLGPYCKGSTPGTLPTTSTNSPGITGTWSPSTISTASSGTTVYTFTPTAGQCATTTTMSIVVTAPPSISITNSNQVICDGEIPASSTLTAVVTPSTGVSYLWSTGATTSNITVTPPLGTTQTYSVTASVGGCTVNASTIVGYYKLPSVSVSPTTATICNGQSVSLSATGTAGSVFTWAPPTGLSSTTGTPVTASPTSTTTYTVTATLNGCTKTATSTITVNPTPTIMGSNNVCIGGGTVSLTGSGTPAATSPWVSSNTGVATVSSTGIVTPVAVGSTNITYKNSSGCQVTIVFTVNPLPLAPSINGGASTLNICNGDYAVLSSTPYTSGIVWTPGSVTSPSISIPAPATSPTTYTATYTNPTTGCKSSASIAVSKVTCTQPGHCLLTANFTYAFNNNCSWTLTSTSTNVAGTIPSPGTGYTFDWTVTYLPSGALVNTGSGYTYTTPSGIFPGSGNYMFCLTVTKTGSSPVCQDQICKTIFVNCDASMVLSTHSEGLFSTFNVKGQNQELMDNMDYEWSFGDGTFSAEKNPGHQYAKPGTYEVCMKAGYGDLTNIPNAVCRTITVTADQTETGVVPMLSVNPNPTSAQTTILVDGAEGKTVEIKLFNMLGEEVTTLFTKTCCNDEMIRLVWNAEEVPPGVYLIKAQVDAKTMVEKIVVSSH